MRINMEIPCDIGTYYGIRSMSFYWCMYSYEVG